MQKTRYFCDICKQEFKPYDLIQAILMNKNIDLCTECNKELIDAFCNLVESKKGGNTND